MVRAPVALALGLSLVSSSGCYSERPPPPNFRYTCESPDDCSEFEDCIRGLCQVPCTQQNAQEQCTDRGFLACVNGTCTSTCGVGVDGSCPGTLECIEVDLGFNGGGGGGGFGGFGGGGGGDEPLGVCATPCTADNGVCPEGQFCFEGIDGVDTSGLPLNVCVALCTTGTDCGPGFDCFMNFCVPEGTDIPGFGDTDESGTAGDETEGTDDAETGGTLTGGPVTGGPITGGVTQ